MTTPQEVHVSDVKTFRGCRWRWDWSSNLRQNLERNWPVAHFLLGRAVHYAMSQYYEGKDAMLSYEAYIERDLELSDHLRGVDEDEKSKLLQAVVLGRGMVVHYLTWAPPRDKNWEVLSTEQTEILEEDGFVWKSRFDGVWRKRSDGTLWLKEFKTTRSMKEFDFIYRDPQPMLYMSVAQNRFKEPIAGVLYTFLWKKAPEMPRVLQSGELSRATGQNTTAALFIEALKQHAKRLAGEDWKRLYDQMTPDYYNIIQHYADQDEKYFLRIELPKTPGELEMNLGWLRMSAREMLDPNVSLYPAAEQLKCPRCPFRDPCRVRHSGGSYELLMREEYRSRKSYGDEMPDDEANS